MTAPSTSLTAGWLADNEYQTRNWPVEDRMLAMRSYGDCDWKYTFDDPGPDWFKPEI